MGTLSSVVVDLSATIVAQDQPMQLKQWNQTNRYTGHLIVAELMLVYQWTV